MGKLTRRSGICCTKGRREVGIEVDEERYLCMGCGIEMSKKGEKSSSVGKVHAVRRVIEKTLGTGGDSE